MSIEKTPGLDVLWSEHKNFRGTVTKKFDSLDAEIKDIQDYLLKQDKKFDTKFDNFDNKFATKFDQLDNKIDKKLEAINNALTQVTTNAINAMPKWAVEASDRKNQIIIGLFGLLAAAIGSVVTVLIYIRH